MDPRLIKAETHQEGQRLPASLVAALTPALRHALNHPIRRRILRALNGSQTARGPVAVATLIHPNPGIGLVRYHLRVLEQLGCVHRVAPDRAAVESAPVLYESDLADDEKIASILQATRQLDRSRD